MSRQPNNLFQRVASKASDLVNQFLGRETSAYSVTDQQIIERLNQLPSCAYTDENPHRSPEVFAQQFNSKSMLTWLYKHHDHPVFFQQNTTALHTLVRLQDIHGIGVLAQQQINMNIKEPASGLNCLNLLTGMHCHSRSRVFHDAQNARMRSGRRDALFTALCLHGSIVDFHTLLQVVTKGLPRKTQQMVCWHYFNQHFGHALQAMGSTTQTPPRHTEWRLFCAQHLKIPFTQLSQAPHQSPERYHRDQLQTIFKTMVSECSSLLSSMGHKAYASHPDLSAPVSSML